MFHLRRLRLALQVRSHHASTLPRHRSSAKRGSGVAVTPTPSPSITLHHHLHPRPLLGEFPSISCFFFHLHLHLRPPQPRKKEKKKAVLFSSRHSPSRPQKGGRDGCEHGFGSGSSALTLCRNRCASGQEGTGGARQVLDEAAAHECSCQNVCVSSPVMTC